MDHMKIRWTRLFTQNLDSARLYIMGEEPQAALNVLKRILGTLDILSTFPEAGKVSKQKVGTRQMIVSHTPFIIAYRIHNDAVELLALWHQSQKWPS
jgi:toxin ParE1/3/4